MCSLSLSRRRLVLVLLPLAYSSDNRGNTEKDAYVSPWANRHTALHRRDMSSEHKSDAIEKKIDEKSEHNIHSVWCFSYFFFILFLLRLMIRVLFSLTFFGRRMNSISGNWTCLEIVMFRRDEAESLWRAQVTTKMGEFNLLDEKIKYILWINFHFRPTNTNTHAQFPLIHRKSMALFRVHDSGVRSQRLQLPWMALTNK